MLEVFTKDPYFFNITVVVVSLYILFKSADLLVYGITDYAKKFGLSDYLIGLVVVAMAASMPEVIASFMGLEYQQAGVLFGAIIGANMVHMALSIGVLALIGKKINIECKILDKALFPMWIMLMLPFLLVSDGHLTRPDGVILVGLFAMYVVMLWKQEGTLGRLKKKVPIKSLWKDIFIFIGCLVALLLAGRWLVFGAVNLANLFNLTPYFIALTVIGIGSTLPDFAIELKSLFKKHEAIGIGDVLGSLAIEIVLYFGVLAIFHPLQVDVNNFMVAGIFLMTSITLMLYFIKQKTLTWKHGMLLLAIYFSFLIIEFYKMAR